jgi:hypothetical protein
MGSTETSKPQNQHSYLAYVGSWETSSFFRTHVS